MAGSKGLDSKPFQRVCEHALQTVVAFQLCYSAKSLYRDFVGMIIFGASEVSGDLGEETNTVICNVVLRASFPTLLNERHGSLQEWLNSLTDGEVRVVSDEEMEAAASNKLKKSIELLAARVVVPPAPPEPEEEDDGELIYVLKPAKKPSTLSLNLTSEEIEHRALEVGKDLCISFPWISFSQVQVSHRF